MNEEKYSEKIWIFKRVTRNNKSKNYSMILPNINNSNTSSSVNLSSDIKNLKKMFKEKGNIPKKLNNLNNTHRSHINLNPKLFKILNSSIIKGDNYKNESNQNILFGKLANNIAIEKMKNYFFYKKNDDNNDDDKNKNEKEENIKENEEDFLKYTNKKSYFKQKSIIEKIIKKKNLSEKFKIKLDLQNIKYRNPFNSLDLLLKNKIIYNNIIKQYKKNTIKGFESSIISLNPALKYKIIQEHDKILNAKKIKIHPYIHKTVTTGLEINNNDISSLNHIDNSQIQKIEDILWPNNNNQKLYLLINYFQYPNKNFPESRTQFSFSQEGKENILYGGFNSIIKPKIWNFSPDDKAWNQIEINLSENDNRYGHTGVLRYRNLYIFGGKLVLSKNLGDLEIFNLDTKEWIYSKADNNLKFELRKNHIASSIGNHMFIHGGINNEEKYLNDAYLLSYKPLKWNIPNISQKLELPPMAYHSCCLVIQEKIRNNSNFNIYKSTNDIKNIDINENVKQKGLYVFGGKIYEKGKIILNKNLYILKIGRNPLEWMIIKTSGIPPCERFRCSMSYYERGNFLVIHGGKNVFPLNDTFLLDLFSLNWLEVEYFNKIKNIPGRYLHQSIIDGNNLFIFGGTNDETFLGSEMFIIELDSNWKCLKAKNEINYVTIIRNKKIKTNLNQIIRENKDFESKSKNIKERKY